MPLYECLCETAARLSANSLAFLPSLKEWKDRLESKRLQWHEMLGIHPLPQRTEMKPTITGVTPQDGFEIRKLHFQPIPHCYISANLYVPTGHSAQMPTRMPAVIYVCGHASRAKCFYQQHPRWFARHGYVCMILDAIQIGENQGFHHGTYSKGWWHWFSQGYSPAAVEVWSAMRAADYLQSLPEVEPELLGITGNSGGGTISWFTGAADPRFKVVVPSCQTGNIFQHVFDRSIDGHCDCSFWVNSLGWDFTDLASLIAPRALLIAAATEDTLFRPYAFRDLFHKARHLYRLFDREDNIALTEAVTKHGYSPHNRLAIFSWFNKHLKGNNIPETEDFDNVTLPDSQLLVFPGGQHPDDDKMPYVDSFFIPLPKHDNLTITPETWPQYRDKCIAALRDKCFRHPPPPVPPPWSSRPQGMNDNFKFNTFIFDSEPGLTLRLQTAIPAASYTGALDFILAPALPDARTTFESRGTGLDALPPNQAFASMEVRGTGATSIGPGLQWTCRRAFPLVGQSLYERQVFDLIRAAQVLRNAIPNIGKITYFGRGYTAPLAIYAAILDESSAGVLLKDPITSHWNGGPEFLNVLKIGDIPHNTALILPRKIDFVGSPPDAFSLTLQIKQSI